MPRILVATSRDDLTWERRALGQEMINDQDTNVLYIAGLEEQAIGAPG